MGQDPPHTTAWISLAVFLPKDRRGRVADEQIGRTHLAQWYYPGKSIDPWIKIDLICQTYRNGSQHLHSVVDGGVRYERGDKKASFRVSCWDDGLISYGFSRRSQSRCPQTPQLRPRPGCTWIYSTTSGAQSKLFLLSLSFIFIFYLTTSSPFCSYIMWYPYYPEDANIKYRFSVSV